jgi:hypothetical protein
VLNTYINEAECAIEVNIILALSYQNHFIHKICTFGCK